MFKRDVMWGTGECKRLPLTIPLFSPAEEGGWVHGVPANGRAGAHAAPPEVLGPEIR